MLIRGRSNLAAVWMALALALGGIVVGVAHEGWAASPSGRVVPPSPIPPVKAKPAPLPPSIQPRSGQIGKSREEPTSQRPSVGSPSYRAPYANCRSSCATSCYNTTPCSDMNVAQCTSARQRCRLTCNSTC
jgi:hypothetical protein